VVDALVGLAQRGRRPGGPRCDWIKLGLERHFDPDLIGIEGLRSAANAMLVDRLPR
jgi:hypothetical protein